MKVRGYWMMLVMVLFAVSCKTAKRLESSGTLDKSYSSRQLVRLHNQNEPKFKTLQARVKVEFKQGDDSQTHTVNLRMERDKTIWISATLGIVRLKITPDQVQFYNKLDQTYFDGDYTLISELLGTYLNFENIQQLLLGQALYPLENNYLNEIYDKSYLLQPKMQSALFEMFYLLNPGHFKLDSQQFAQPDEQRLLQIDYKDYQKVNREILPRMVEVIALDSNEETKISMEYRSVSLNEELRFPFRIPSGFQEIVVR